MFRKKLDFVVFFVNSLKLDFRVFSLLSGSFGFHLYVLHIWEEIRFLSFFVDALKSRVFFVSALNVIKYLCDFCRLSSVGFLVGITLWSWPLVGLGNNYSRRGKTRL